MALFGGFLLAADPRRDWNRIFAIFAIFWGAQIVAANAVRVIDDPAVARPFAIVGIALLVPLYFFIVVFAAVYPRPRAPFATSWSWLLVLTVPAAAGLMLLVAAPSLLLSDVVAVPEGGATVRWGPLFTPLILVPLYGGFFYALFVMMERFGETDVRVERRQVLAVLTALGLFVAYNVPLQLILFGSAAVGAGARSEADWSVATWIGGVMLVGCALLVALVARLVRMWRAATSRTSAREVRAVLLALTAAAAVGITEGTVAVAGGPRVQMVGFVRVVAVGLIAYGVARFQLFDLDLRLKRATHLLTTVILLAVAGIVLWSVGGPVARAATFWPYGALILLTVVAFPLGLVVRRIAHRVAPHVSQDGEHIYLRKLEVYQAALAGSSGRDTEGLHELRRRLGLGQEDHDIAVRLAESKKDDGGLAPGRVAFDRYLVEAVIGEGAFGRVFVARDLKVGRRVAIKELEAHWRQDPAARGRFLREARVMGRLAHPCIVTLHEVERRGADQFLVLEHVEGGNLDERLQAGRLPPREALSIFRDVVQGLAVAHAKGVVHRDLKPANVLLDLEGRAKIADFGVAAIDGPADETLVGLPDPQVPPVVGNLLYMAPEQARGEPATAQSDLYAAGALLFHMLSGRPHRRLSGLDAVAARSAAAATALPSLRPFGAVERRLLERTLAPDPKARVAHAGALLEILRSGGHDGPAAPSVPALDPPPPTDAP